MKDEKSAAVFIGFLRAETLPLFVQGEGGLETQQETGECYSLSGPLASACHKTRFLFALSYSASMLAVCTAQCYSWGPSTQRSAAAPLYLRQIKF